MKTISLLRFFIGYVEFEAIGGFNDRFINLCNFHHVNIFDITYKDNCICACVPLKSIYKLKNPVKKSGVKLKFVNQHGFYFMYKKHNRRMGLVAGLIFYALFCIIMQQFVWSIDIQQSKNVSNQDIKDLLNDNGLQPGTHIDTFDEIACSRRIVNTLEGKLQWMAINIKGSKAFVEIHDYNEEPKDETYSDPSNIVADFDGILISIEAFVGEKAAKIGNGVNKGDLLISGIVENRDFSASFFEARGRITALHNINYSFSLNSNEAYKTFSENSDKTSLHFLGIKIPLTFCKIKKNSVSYNNNSFLFFKNSELPFGICKNHILKFSDNKPTLTKEKNALMTLTLYTEKTYDKFSNTNIINCKHNLKFTNDTYNITSNYSCIDFMGVKQPINTNIF